jgi:hypothetical protein
LRDGLDAITNKRKKFLGCNNLGYALINIKADLSPSGEEVLMVGVLHGVNLTDTIT